MSINEQLTELQEQLKLQDSKITGLKENVKWLYKYGGSGTGSSSGGDSSSTKTSALVYSSSEGNIVVELGNTTSNTYIATEGTQNLSFFLRYLNKDHVYKVSYSVNGGLSWTSVSISENNDFIIPLNITSNINTRIRLQDVTDNSLGPATLILNFITKPISITTYLIGENANGLATVSGEIFMQNYTKIWAVIDVIPYLSGTFEATSDSLSEDFNLEELEIGKTYTNKQLLYDSTFLQDPSNVGAYSLKYSTKFNSSISGIQTQEFEQSYTLIPNSAYTIIKAEEGSIYSSKKDSNYYEFSAGAITFIGYIYKGSNDGETFQTVTTEIYNDQGTLLHTFPVSTPVTERENFLSGTIGTFYFNNSYITDNEGNWFEIRVTIAQNIGDTPQVQSYYLFIKKSTNVLNWYPDTIAGEWYFNKENKSTITDSISEISCQLSTTPKIYEWTNNLTVNTPETHVALAIKAEEGNDEVLLAKLNTTTGYNINIYQNKIELANYGSIEIYYPMDNQYHLLQLYGRIVEMADINTPKYEWVVYIDGIIEGALATFTKANISLNGLILNPDVKGVFNVNHFNYTVFDCGTYRRWDSGYLGLNDTNITEYYYKYLCTTNTAYKEADYASTIQAFKTINYTYNANTNKQEYLTKLSASDVSVLQTNGGLPVLILQVKSAGLNNILNQMQTSYGEEDEPGAIELENIKYYKIGNTEEETCNTTLSSSEYYYSIEIQGSSTKGYKFKNWELGINSHENEIIPIFSLDYNEDRGFFPEQSFTLKGDIVDSSHCVNTSIGDFVNTNCTPFNVGYQNCLSGKPLLILVENVPDGSEATASEYYLFGIYNYNLGRKSKFNLNYADRPDIDTKATGFIVQTTRSTSTKATYASAEISNNSCFWDFSQYDNSILFENAYKMEDGSTPTSDFLSTHEDTYYMWGDLVYSQGFDINTKIQNCVKSISRAGGFLFDSFLKKEFDSEAYFTELNESSTSKSWKVINHVPDSKHKYIRKVKYNSNSNSYSYIFEPATEEENTYTQLDLTDCIYGRFDAEGNIVQQPYINYNSVMEYYVIMQAFGLVDSPMKNLNMKTWNGDTFYAAFYDMDTGLGGDNAGSMTITPFAFSDYWETNDDGIVTRHLDYWPEDTTEIGFDVPSSFLFAIGKYAAYYRQANPSIGDTLLSPMEFWAKLRQPTGSLRNAEYFVNNYFNSKFAKTHPVIWNMNYRSKYLVQSTDSYDNTQFSKFHGRRLNRTKAWLNNRLHMLDAYFNVNNLAYSAENNKDASLKIIQPDSSINSLSQNSDVIILQNIFSNTGTDSIKTNQNINCVVETLDYSPFIAQSTNNTSDIRLFNSGTQYDISIAVTGNQSIYPYGCSRWTSMDSVNSFLQNNTLFYIKNDHMTNFNCDKTYNTSFSPSGWELHTPKMQKVSITGKTFKNTLQIYPGTALTDLDLSNTSITFETQATGSYNVCPNLKNLTLNNFTGSVKLLNCNLLDTLSVNEAVLTSLEVNPYKGNCTFSDTQIKTLKIVSDAENTSFKLTNDPIITDLELSGFESVIVSDCKNLVNIKLTGTLPKVIKFENCIGGINFVNLIDSNGLIDFKGVTELSFYNSKFSQDVKTIKGSSELTIINGACSNNISYESDIAFDLIECTNLEQINLSYCFAKSVAFKAISIDNSKVNLQHGNIQSITGSLTIVHNNGYTFYDCRKLSSLETIIFDESVTNAAYTFANCCSLNTINSLTVKGVLTSVERMCESTAFTSSKLIATAIAASAPSITSIKACFQNSKVVDFSDFLKLSWNSITTKDAMLAACNSGVDTLITSISANNLTFTNAPAVDPLCLFQKTDDWWGYSKNTTIPFISNSLSNVKSTSLDFSQIIVSGITNTDFLTKATKCTDVSNLEFTEGTTLTFGNNDHIQKFTNCIQNNTVITSSVNSFFQNFTSITSSLNSLNLTGGLQIASFVNYSNLKTSTQLFSADFDIKKKITHTDFINLVATIFDSTDNNLTSIQGVFKNCTISCTEDCYTAGSILEVPIPANSKVTDISNLFDNCHAFYTSEDDGVVYRIYLKFVSGDSEGFSNLTSLRKCLCAWKDCYIHKLTENWFANVKGNLTNCDQAFKFTQFKQRYSDDITDKIPYTINAEITIGNQNDMDESARSSKVLNSQLDSEFTNAVNGYYIIPNKFFYYDNNGALVNKASALFSANEIFMASNLYGLLPDKLFATNSRPTSNCSSMFKYCTIVPYYVTTKYQTLIPSDFDYSLAKEILPYTTYKIDIYCITPNGTETSPYLTGALGDSISGAIIIPTIRQKREVSVRWDAIASNINEDSKNYVNLKLTPTPDVDIDTEKDVNIGIIDFIYQYNQYSLDQTVNNLQNLLPSAIGITEDYIQKYVSLDWDKHKGTGGDSVAWDTLFSGTNWAFTSGLNGNKLTWAYNYQPSTVNDIKCSDELFKVHYGIQYNGGDTLLFVDDTNTDGLTCSSTSKINATGLINTDSALLLYGPIFNKDLKVITNIQDNEICRVLELYQGSEAQPYGAQTTSTAGSGYRFYHTEGDIYKLYAYDISRNLVFPESINNSSPITQIVRGRTWTTNNAYKYQYKAYRYYTKRGIGNYNNYVTLYS